MKGTIERWLRRGRRRLFLRLQVGFVYSRRYQLELPGASYDSRRGERILTFLDSTGLLAVRAVHRPEPATFRHLRRVHSDDYLDSLNSPAALTPVVGFQLAEDAADRVLDTQRLMVGGTLLAARLALEQGIGINLGGGLHHAFPARGERFCVLNDVAVAIADLRAAGWPGKVLVVDLDLHDGDGTRAIFATDPTVHTFSIHNQTNGATDAVEATIVELPGPVQDGEYLESVRAHLPPVCEAFGPELVFYVAGNDPAADDQIGNWKITAEGLLERDRFVISCVRGGGGISRQIPLAIVLGGGYGLNAWRYSARFFSTLLNRGRALEPPTTEEITLLRYRQLARDIAPHELTGEPGEPSEADWGLTADDILPGMAAVHRPRRLLGYYSLPGLELTLERAGLLDRMRNLGFQPTLELDLDNPAGDTFRLYGDAARTELLVECRVRIDRATAPEAALVRIEWLLMQNPRARFTAQRPRLPGQRHPGLGVLPDLMALLIVSSERLGFDGLLFVPSHYHTACQGRKYLRLLIPEDEAFMRALEKALAGIPLAEATHAVEQKRIIDTRTGTFVPWRSMPMAFPVTERLRERIGSAEFERQVAEAEMELQLT
jgi:acetoin utilization deacetylase AcuC-like enzyme